LPPTILTQMQLQRRIKIVVLGPTACAARGLTSCVVLGVEKVGQLLFPLLVPAPKGR